MTVFNKLGICKMMNISTNIVVGNEMTFAKILNQQSWRLRMTSFNKLEFFADY